MFYYSDKAIEDIKRQRTECDDENRLQIVDIIMTRDIQDRSEDSQE